VEVGQERVRVFGLVEDDAPMRYPHSPASLSTFLAEGELEAPLGLRALAVRLR